VSKHVPIIDDEEDIREVARLSLEVVGGWVVSTAASGREGIATAVAQRPDAVLLDVMMPEMDGPTTLQLLQQNERTSGIPVIFLTAKVQASDRRQFDGLEVAGVFAKPFDPLRLPADIAEALGWAA
jgi:two-component system alkaline phosphatase synthesis response regulator PhoP